MFFYDKFTTFDPKSLDSTSEILLGLTSYVLWLTITGLLMNLRILYII